MSKGGKNPARINMDLEINTDADEPSPQMMQEIKLFTPNYSLKSLGQNLD